MKGKCLTGLAAMGVALSVQAQSNVTLWGRVGGGVEYVSGIKTGPNTSGSRVAEGSHWGTSIWGMRGTEDLGDGNQALFLLEGAFASDTGVQGGGKLFQRAAWVGLKNEKAGFLRLGQGNFINNYIWGYDPFLLEDYSASTFTNYRNGSKLANGIRYESPSFGGLEFAAQLNLGEGLNGFRSGPADTVVQNGMAWGASVAYRQRLGRCAPSTTSSTTRTARWTTCSSRPVSCSSEARHGLVRHWCRQPGFITPHLILPQACRIVPITCGQA